MAKKIQKSDTPDTTEWPIGALWYGVRRESEAMFRWTCPQCETDHATGGPKAPVLRGCCHDQFRARATRIQIDRKLKRLEKPKRKRGRPKKVTTGPKKG